MLRNLLGLFMILLSNGEAVSSQVLEAATPPQRHIVEIREFSFHPKRTVASPRDTVVRLNGTLCRTPQRRMTEPGARKNYKKENRGRWP